MPARSTRQEARARILAAFSAQLNRLIPEDESVPLKGTMAAVLVAEFIAVILLSRADGKPTIVLLTNVQAFGSSVRTWCRLGPVVRSSLFGGYHGLQAPG